MIVCLCNALTDHAIRQSCRDGASCSRGVWERCACRPDCGQCGATIKRIIAEHARALATAVPAVPAPAGAGD